MKQLNNSAALVRKLATTALVSVSLFPLIVITLNLVQRRDYSPSRQAISELALGTGGGLMVIAFSGLGIGILLLALIIFRTSSRARVTPLLLAVASVLAGPVSAAFRTDRTGAETTMHGNIHNGAGLVAFLLILIAMITAVHRFRHEPEWRSHAAPTTTLAVLGVVTFCLIPMLGNSHFGLSQRLFVGTFVAWLLIAAAHARKVGTAEHVAHGRSSDAEPATGLTIS